MAFAKDSPGVQGLHTDHFHVELAIACMGSTNCDCFSPGNICWCWKSIFLTPIIPMRQSRSRGRWRHGCWRSFWSLSPPPFWSSGPMGWMRLSTAESHTYPWKYILGFFGGSCFSYLSMKWMWSGCVSWLLQIVIWGEVCSKDRAAVFIERLDLVRKFYQMCMNPY